jgi:hypothetical protein
VTRSKPWAKTRNKETTLWNIDKEKTLGKNKEHRDKSLKTRTRRKPWAKTRNMEMALQNKNKEKTLGKNKKSSQDERGTNVSLLKGLWVTV